MVRSAEESTFSARMSISSSSHSTTGAVFPGRWMCAGFLIAALALPSSALGEENKTAARALAVEGANAFAAGDDDRAIELLEKAEKFYHATPHLLLMAKAHLRRSRLIEAKELLLAIIHEPVPEKANPVLQSTREEADGLLVPLDERIPTVLLRPAESLSETLTIQIDGRPVDPALVGVAQPINPGRRTITASAPGYQKREQTIDVAEGARLNVLVELDREVAAPSTSSTGSAGTSTSGIDWTLPAIGYGVGAAGIAAGVVLLVLADSDSSAASAKLENECSGGTGSSFRCDQATANEVAALDSDAATKQSLSWVGFGVGAAGIGLGTYFLLTGSSSTPQQLARLPRLAPLPGGGYIDYRFTF